MPTEVLEAVLQYLSSEKIVTLATASADGAPHASTFMYVNDRLSIYFWARPASATAKYVRENPRVAFAIDEYVADWNRAKGIQGEGRCEPVLSDEITRAVELFGDKFPSPSSAASTAYIEFFKITPSRLQFIDNEGAKLNLSEDDFGMDFHREVVLAGGGDA